MPKADRVMAKLRKQGERMITELGFLRADIEKADENRLAYIARQVTRLDIETAFLSRTLKQP